MKTKKLTHRFVETIPENKEEGVLYISIKHKIVVHLCACGCGEPVYTPISPKDWQLYYDGDSVSLSPSIGNFHFPCHSHYWISNDNAISINTCYIKKNKRKRK